MEKFNVEISILPKAVWRFNEIFIKISVIVHRNSKNNSKIHMEPQKALNNQSNSEKEEQSKRHHTFQN